VALALVVMVSVAVWVLITMVSNHFERADQPVQVEIVNDDSRWYVVDGAAHADMVEAGVISPDTVCKVSVPFGNDTALTVCDNGYSEES
jgi:hypothetical protein